MISLINLMLYAFAFCNLKICFLHAQSTTISPINEITPSLVASSPATLAITTVAQEIPTSFAPSASKLKLKSEELLLAGEALKLLIAPSEKAVEFTISLSSKILSQSSTLDLKGAKRFLLALENDHFNVDVIGIPFVNDTGASLAFGNSIEDFSWNKKNGVMLLDVDTVPNYVWISSGAKENGSTFFVTFSREWVTCDEQDIQFTASSLKVWWLVETKDNITSSTRTHTKAYHKMLEKQEVEPSTTTNPAAEPTESVIVSSTQAILTTSNTMLVTPTLAAGNLSAKNDNETSESKEKPTSSPTSQSDEVEILKSIEQYNFKGPVNLTFTFMMNNETSVYLKACDESNTLFLCNFSTLQQISQKELTTNIPSILFIWRIANSVSANYSVNIPEYQTKPCGNLSELVRRYQPSNKKFFNALSGNRTPKSHIPAKNGYAPNPPQSCIFFTGIVLSCLLRTL